MITELICLAAGFASATIILDKIWNKGKLAASIRKATQGLKKGAKAAQKDMQKQQKEMQTSLDNIGKVD